MKRFACQLMCVLGLCIAAAANAAPIVFTASLSGPAEAPPNASPGTGFAIVTFDPVAHLMQVVIDFAGLLGTTTAAHIHCCVDPPGTVGVATQTPFFIGFPIGVTSGHYDNTFDMALASSYSAGFLAANGGTAAGAEAALFEGMVEGRAYVNVHSSQFPGGEIRGFLIPEPATLALLAIGVMAIGVATERRRAG